MAETRETLKRKERVLLAVTLKAQGGVAQEAGSPRPEEDQGQGWLLQILPTGQKKGRERLHLHRTEIPHLPQPLLHWELHRANQLTPSPPQGCGHGTAKAVRQHVKVE